MVILTNLLEHIALIKFKMKTRKTSITANQKKQQLLENVKGVQYKSKVHLAIHLKIQLYNCVNMLKAWTMDSILEVMLVFQLTIIRLLHHKVR